MLDQAAIERLASLSKLELAEDEVAHYTEEIQKILDLVEELQKVDTEGINPTFHGNHNHNVFREDVAKKSDLPRAMLSNAPDAEGSFIRVPVILESEEA